MSKSSTITIPAHIIRKSKLSKWYRDTIKDKWIHKDNLETYINQKQTASRPVPTRF